MANIKITDKNNQEQTFNGVKVLTVNKDGGGVVNFTENPLLLDTSQNAPAQFEGMFCEDVNTHGSYKITRGNSGDFIVKNNFPEEFCCYKIISAKGLFVALGLVRSGTGDYYLDVYISNDGLSWTRTLHKSKSDSGYDDQRKACDIAYGNGKFVIYSRSGRTVYSGHLYVSTDAINWTETYISDSSPGFVMYPKLAYGNGMFLMISRMPSNSSEISVTKSLDGITWTSKSSISIEGNTGYSPSSLDYIAEDELFYLVKGNNAYETSDGISWTMSSLPTFLSHYGYFLFKFNNYYYSGDYRNSKYCVVKAQKNDSDWVIIGEDVYSYSCCSVNNKLYVAGNATLLIYNGTTANIQNFVINSSRGKITANNGTIVILRDQNSNLTTDYVISESSNEFYYRPIYY